MQERSNPLDPEILKIKADALPLEGNASFVSTYKALKNGGMPTVLAIEVASKFHPKPKSKK